MYVASYVLKAEKGMGELLQMAAKETSDKDIRTQLRKAGSVFLTHREVTAQEAVYRVLSIPLRQISRKVIFIDNNPPDKRVSLLLPKYKLDQKEDDDEDIFCMNMIDRYAHRPTALENMCLAEFVANYTTSADSTQPDESQEPATTTALPRLNLLNNKGKIFKRRKEAVIRWHNFNPETQSEDHYRSKLMLFQPWRNEDDLKGQHDTFQSKYLADKDNITPNEEHYTHDEGELNEAYQDLIDEGIPVNAWENISPNLAELEHDANIEGAVEDRPLQIEEDDVELNVPRPSKTQPTSSSLLFTKEKNRKLMSSKAYNKCMRSLNKKQKDIVLYHRQWCKQVVYCHKTNQKVIPYQVFLSGPGGVGKSFVIKMIHHDTVKLLRHSPQISAEDIPILLTASTGVAAFNIQGMTVHSAFSINNRKRADGSYLPLSANKANSLQTDLEQLHVVIIDEVSMIGARTLHQIHRRLQEIKKLEYANSRFGNVTVIAVGDLYQLPPFKDQKVFSNPGSATNPSIEVLHGSLWRENFQCHELTEVVRQKDKDFINILNRVRKGEAPDELSELVVTKDDPHYMKDALHVFGTNARCYEHNTAMLRELSTTVFDIPSVDCKKDKKTGQLQVDVSKSKRSDTGNLEFCLSIAEGAKVKLTTNIDVSDGLSNGARGIVTKIITCQEQVKHILVTFENPDVGINAKSKSKFKKEYPSAVPLERHGTNFLLSKGVEISRTQFPLTLAWACTIHSVQGLTVDNIVVNMDDMFDYAHAYVAFSRVRTIQGLQILGKYDPTKIRADSKVTKEMQRLQEKTLQIPASLTPTQDTGCLRLSHINVQGYLTNLPDVLCDDNLRNCDIVCYTETHLNHTQDVSRKCQPNPNFQQFRKDREVDNTKGGVMVHVDPTLQPKVLPIFINNLEFVAIEIRSHKGRQLQIVTVYKPPSSLSTAVFLHKLQDLLDQLHTETKDTILVGDFNEDLLVQSNPQIKDVMQEHHFKQQITKPTTDYGSLLDHIYHNMSNITETYSVIDAYYSDHDIIVVEMKL